MKMSEGERKLGQAIENRLRIETENANILNAIHDGLGLSAFDEFSPEQLSTIIKNQKFRDKLTEILDRLVTLGFLAYDAERKKYWLTREGWEEAISDEEED